MNKKDDGNIVEFGEATIIQADYIIDDSECGQRVSRAKAIRLKCLDCCAYQYSEVKLCASKDCPLWRYRMGKEEKDQLYYDSHPSISDED